jgi:hypothetical protein
MMPFVSEAQRKYMHAKHPEIAKEWEAHTPSGARLPEKVATTARKEKRAGGVHPDLARALKSIEH